MTDKWFLQDLEYQLKQRNRAVIFDPKCQCEFLLKLLEQEPIIVFKTDSAYTERWQTVQEELFMRHEAEMKYVNKRVVFYVTRKAENLSFLFDYCFTHGWVDLSNPTDWLRKKIYANTGLQIQMDSPMLLTAAKLGVGKDIYWWKKIVQNLEELISVEAELLPFLNDPEGYFGSKDPDIKRLFEEKLFELIGQPYMTKPAKTLAQEVVKQIFDGLVSNNLSTPLLPLYYHWIDSETYRPSLTQYIANYKIDSGANPWAANPNHCFYDLDLKALRQLTENIRDNSLVHDKLAKLKLRAKSNKVGHFVPEWWMDVITLLEFDTRPISNCKNLNDVVKFYTQSFSKADRAIRNIYSAFLHEKTTLRPLQEHYESLNHELLDKWTSFADEFKSNQSGFLVNLLRKAKPGTVVIVGDGIRYEIADYIAGGLENQFKVERQVILADVPSETENNMSIMYTAENDVLSVHKEREEKLSQASGKEITYLNLEAVHYGIQADYLVLTYKDIDSSGEKLQQGAIKLFEEFEQVLQDKIAVLFNMGYKEVHLVSDHGFVLTGLLDEADKIDPNAAGKKEVHERFIRTCEKQSNAEWIGFEKSYGDYKYVYTAKSHRPFKSRGTYGYSHGGFTPQEIIVPSFVFRKQAKTFTGLRVEMTNKQELSDVTGELFTIKVKAYSNKADLFSSIRKIQILLYSKGISFSSSQVLTLEPEKDESIEFSFGGNSVVQAVLVDAGTQEQLDSVTIKKSNIRDLNGLL